MILMGVYCSAQHDSRYEAANQVINLLWKLENLSLVQCFRLQGLDSSDSIMAVTESVVGDVVQVTCCGLS
jgi:hypothetical protein